MGSGFIVFIISLFTKLPFPDTPMNTSAPFITSKRLPLNFKGFDLFAISLLYGFSIPTVRFTCNAPMLSVTIISVHPASINILNIPYPAEPAPAITTLILSIFFVLI